MNWHETVLSIQGQSEYRSLIQDAYISDDIVDNVQRFRTSEEFKETLLLIREMGKFPCRMLDVGSGNGISAISFALEGFEVDAVEPDESELVGRKAIKKLKQHFSLDNITIKQGVGEQSGEANSYDLIYGRQVLHHASDLDLFVKNLANQLKQDGLFIMIRDHVVYDATDKEIFLKSHPLHEKYGGENAFTQEEYNSAFEHAGLEVKKRFGHYDSIINYAPLTKEEVQTIPTALVDVWKKRIGSIAESVFIKRILRIVYSIFGKVLFDERNVPGRLVSHVLIKKS